MLGITWTFSLLQHTHRVPQGWACLVEKDWDWLRLYGDADLPRFADSDNVQLFMSSITKQSWSGVLRKARCRVIVLQREADRDALARFQDSIFMDFGACASAPEVQTDNVWPWSYCHKSFASFQAVRRHESGAHKVQHVANLYLLAW